jgi:uncharacterized protein YegP (UPF0339 family)
MEAKTVTGYYQFIEGHQGNFKFALRAGNHETILESGVYWSRGAALDAIAAARRCSQDSRHFFQREDSDGSHYFELRDDTGKVLARSAGCNTRSSLASGIASVRRNAPSTTFRGLIRRDLQAPAAAGLAAY